MYPMRVTDYYKTCRLNLFKSKVDSMSLGTTVVTTDHQFAHHVITWELCSAYLTVWFSHVIWLYVHYWFKTFEMQSGRDTEIRIKGDVGFKFIWILLYIPSIGLIRLESVNFVDDVLWVWRDKLVAGFHFSDIIYYIVSTKINHGNFWETNVS